MNESKIIFCTPDESCGQNVSAPSPQELAQQLADLIGLQLTVFRTHSDTTRFVLGDNATGSGPIPVVRPVDWSNTQDSKVTAEPKGGNYE